MTRSIQLSSIVNADRLSAIVEMVDDRTAEYLRVAADGTHDPERAKVIRSGIELLRPGANRPENLYETPEGTWGYWAGRFSINAFQATYILQEHSWRIPRARSLGILQIGGGPGEDLIGILETMRIRSQWPSHIRYLSVDPGAWELHLDHLRKVMTPSLYGSIPVEVHETLKEKAEQVSVPLLPAWVKESAHLLVVVANALVSDVSPSHVARLYRELDDWRKEGIIELLVIEQDESGLDEVISKVGATGTHRSIHGGEFKLNLRLPGTHASRILFKQGARSYPMNLRRYRLLVDSSA